MEKLLCPNCKRTYKANHKKTMAERLAIRQKKRIIRKFA